MSPKKSVIRKGPASRKGNALFISVKEDEPATVVPLQSTQEIISIDLHGFWDTNPAVTFACLAMAGEKCPGCEAGNDPGYRAFLPVLNAEGELKIWPFGISIERQLVNLEEELGGIKGLKLRVKRTGKGLSTKYQVINTGKTVDTDDVDASTLEDFVEENLEIKSRKAIIDEMVRAGLIEGDASVEADEDEPKPAKAKAAKPKVKPAPEEEAEDEWDE